MQAIPARRSAVMLAAAALTFAVLASCSSSGHRTAAAGDTPAPVATTQQPSPTTSASATTVWLCRPGATPDPCVSDLTATVVTASGARHREAAPAPVDTGLDCFYVYPTVSREGGANADLRVQPAETDVAVAQAARFSPVCHVWAPMYRQRTVTDLLNLSDGAVNSLANRTAFASVEAAWRDYLAHDNHGRPVVLIGHSQGAAMLIRLIRADIDPSSAARAKLALAILLGGNVTVADGSVVGGSFQHVPLCTRPAQHGCVIAYSSFPSQPSAFSLFGRAGSGVSLLSGETATNRQVACVNPARIGGGAAPLLTYFPTSALHVASVTTPWVAAPARFTAECRHAGTATWLQVTAAPHDVRPSVSESLGPAWGFHIADVNLSLGNLVDDVRALSAGARR